MSGGEQYYPPHGLSDYRTSNAGTSSSMPQPSSYQPPPPQPRVYEGSSEGRGWRLMFTDVLPNSRGAGDRVPAPSYDERTRIYTAPCQMKTRYAATGSKRGAYKVLPATLDTFNNVEIRTKSQTNNSFISLPFGDGVEPQKSIYSTRSDGLVDTMRVIPMGVAYLPAHITDRDFRNARATEWTFTKHEIRSASDHVTVVGQVSIQLDFV